MALVPLPAVVNLTPMWAHRALKLCVEAVEFNTSRNVNQITITFDSSVAFKVVRQNRLITGYSFGAFISASQYLSFLAKLRTQDKSLATVFQALLTHSPLTYGCGDLFCLQTTVRKWICTVQ